MDDLTIIENLKRSIGLDLPLIVIRATEEPYIVRNNGQAIGQLQLKGAELYFQPNERFKPHSHIIDAFIGDEDFKDKVKNICSLVVQVKKAEVQGFNRIISIKEKDYHLLLRSPMYEAIIESLKESFEGEMHFKIEETGELKKIRTL